MILALIPAVSTFIAMSLIGFSVLGQIVRISLLSGIVNMVIGYVAWLLMIYVIALLTDLLAPSFNAQKNPMNALKLIAYSSTPSLLGGLFVLVPILSSLLALAASLYSVYLLFQGIPVMMDVAREKALPYTAVLTIGSIVAAVLISMFVSFTLDPMLSAVWHDPAVQAEGQPFRPVTLYERTLGRITHAVDRGSHRLGEGYQALLGWSLRHRLLTVVLALGTLVAALALTRSLGTEFVPKADYSETFVSFHTPVGSSLEVTEARVREVEALIRRRPEVKYTLATINAGQAQGRIFAQIYIRLVDRKDRQLSQDQLAAPLRQELLQVPGITVTHVGLLDAVGGNKPLMLSLQGSDLGELQRQTERLLERLRGIPGLVDLDSSARRVFV